MEKAKVIISGVAWTIIQNVVNILYGIVSVPFLIHYFGKEEYGLIGIALSVNIYIQLLDMGMTNSNVRFFSEYLAKDDKERVQRLFSLTHLFYMVIGLLNSVILFGLSFFVDSIFNVTPVQAITLRNLLWILALNATFSWISICFDQFLRANELIDWIKKRGTFLKLLQFAVLVATIVFRYSIEIYFFSYIFLATAILPLSMVKVHRIMPMLKFKMNFHRDIFIIIFPYALSIFSFSIFQFLTFNFRPLFLGNMSGPGAVTEFSIMNTIAMVVTIISGSFMQVLLPIVTKMRVNADQKGIFTIVQDGTKYVTILLSTIIFLLILSIREILTLYVGEEYAHLSTWMTIWLLTLLLSHRNVMTSLVLTEKRLKSVAIMGAFAMCVALSCYYIFIPKYGVGGVVIGFTAHELIHTLFYYLYFLPKKFHFNTAIIFFHSVCPTWLSLLGGCVFCYWTPNLFSESTLAIILSKMALYVFVSAGIIWTAVLNNNDKRFLLSLIIQKKAE